MARKVDVLETDRLLLRGIDETDAVSIVKWRSDPEVYRYFKTPRKITLEEHLLWYRNRYKNNADRFDWICIEKKNGNRVGVFGLCREEEKTEVNYLLAPEAQHNGYAVEILHVLIQYASKAWHCKRIVAEIHKDNQPSVALVTKIGFDLISEKPPFVEYELEV